MCSNASILELKNSDSRCIALGLASLKKAKQEAQIEIEKQKGVAEANKHLVSSLTPTLIEYKKLQIKQQEIDKWNGAYPTTVVNGAVTPLLSTK